MRSRYQEVIYQNLCSLINQELVVYVKEFQGKFEIDIRSDIFRRLLFNGEYEPTLIQYCHKYIDKQKDVIDVGANIGFYSVFFAKIIDERGRILSVEPTKNALLRLNKNLKMNEVENKVIVYEGVASNSNGVIPINIVEGKEEYSSIGKMKHPSICKMNYISEKVKSTTIDSLVNEYSMNPGFMKVDVEGVEHLVFEGCKNVLEKKRPIILSELSDILLKENGSSAKDVIIKFIKKYEYDVIDPLSPSVLPGSRDFGEILCIPK